MTICLGTIQRPGGAASWCAVLVATFGLGMLCDAALAAEPSWRPVEGHLMPRWAKDVSALSPLPALIPLLIRITIL